MANEIGFWTPIKYEGPSASWPQKIREYADSYFYLGGRVAVVIPGVTENGSTGVKVQEEPCPLWKTALKVASYFTLFLPVIMLQIKLISRAFYLFHECQRTLPDGTHEAGTFINGVLQKGIRTQGGQTVFLCPKLLLSEPMLRNGEIELNFAEVTIDGRTQIIPVQTAYKQRVCASTKEYMRYPGSLNEALLKIAEDTPYRLFRSENSPNDLREFRIKFILELADKYLPQTKSFLTYLLTPNDQDRLPLHTINKKSLFWEILELAQSNSLTIDLRTIDPVTRETLFSKWAGTGDVKLTQALLKLDPSVIRQTEGREESFFMRAVLGGFTEEAQLLLQAMQENLIQLTPADRWIQKAFTNDCHFTQEEFLQLPIELRKKIFKVANTFIHKEFLQKLRDFGMHQPPAQPEGAALFSYNMDALDVERTLQTFLSTLRKEGLLLTKEEFGQKSPAQYFSKGDDIGRILGRDYIERTAKRLHLSYIKVPKKTAVIQPENAQTLALAFTVSRGGEMDIKCPHLQIYAERIEPLERNATRAEMKGLLDLLEATGFNDFYGQNLLIGKNQNGEEGIYFIDTEYTNFSSLPCYDNIGMLGRLMAQEDHPWLQEELNKRVNLFLSQKEARKSALQREWEQQKPALIEYGFADRRKPFVLNIADLVAQEICEAATNQ